MQRLAKRIARGDWENHKRDKDLGPFLNVKQELSVADIFSENVELYYHLHFKE